jgi:hypothetical protein
MQFHFGVLPLDPGREGVWVLRRAIIENEMDAFRSGILSLDFYPR